jgi:hypothetical protein
MWCLSGGRVYFRRWCTLGKSGGDLGSFGPGQMVKEFNDVVFGEEYEVGPPHPPTPPPPLSVHCR